MKRVLSLVLAFVLVLGMVPAVNFAAESNFMDDLVAAGVVEGDGQSYNLEGNLNRAELAALLARMNGVDAEARNYPGTSTFTDLDGVSWAHGYIAYAEQKEWMRGEGNGIFNPNGTVTGKEVLVTSARVLGFELDWNLGDADFIIAAQEKGLAVATLGVVTRGQAFQTQHQTLFVVPNAQGVILAEEYGWKAPDVPVVTELEVESVDMGNRKTMTIDFNQAVDKETVTKSNIKVVQGTTDRVANLFVSEDATRVVVEYNTSVQQSTELKLTIDGVQAADQSSEITEYELTAVMNDVTIPQILGVTALNAKNIQVEFSEPMDHGYSEVAFQVINNIKLDGTPIIAKVSQNFLTNTVNFELTSVLDAKEYAVVVENMVDYAGYKAIAYTGSLVVVEDKEPPVLLGAEVKNVNTIVATFDESVETLGEFLVNGVAATPTYVENSNKTKVSLALGSSLDLAATVEIRLEYKGQKDVVGNEIKDKMTHLFNIADDTALPTVTVDVQKGNKVVLTFDKSMNTGEGTIHVLNKDQKALSPAVEITVAPALFKANTNNTVIELTATQLGLNNVDPATYHLNIKGMQDATIRKNPLAEVMYEFESFDTKAPTVVSTYTVKAGTATGTNFTKDDTITFYFSEAMDVETAKNLSNYRNNVSGLPFSAIEGVSFKSISADNKNVTITYPNARILTDSVSVFALKDLAGNMMVSNINVILNSAVDFPTTISAEATNKTTVVVTFARPIQTIDPSFMKVQKWDADKSEWNDYAVPVVATVGTGANNNKVTFTLNRAIDADTTDFRVVGNNIQSAVNIYGNKMAEATVPATVTSLIGDKISPTFRHARVSETTSSAIVVTFDEAVQAGNLTLLPFDLRVMVLEDTARQLVANTDYTVSFDAGKMIITLNASANIDAKNVSVELLNGRYVTDTSVNTNTALGFDAVTVRNHAGNANAVFTVQ